MNTATTPALASLSEMLADSPAVKAVISRAPIVAVAESARTIFVAALANRTIRRPIVVAVPTGADADRLAQDLLAFLPASAVEVFPAWETLPFERVSPALETMGRRQRVLWRLRTGDFPAVVVAPIRALIQRLGPSVGEFTPVVLRRGTSIDRDEILNQLVTMGYRREYQVEGRGEVAIRGSILDIYPTTADHPVRVDLWGDEIDHLSEFSIADQRSTIKIEEVSVFPAREVLPTPELMKRAEQLRTKEPWGAQTWDRFSRGEIFDGMESWLPWLTDSETLLTDFLSPDALVLVCEPRRARDRAKDFLTEEFALAETLASTWGATGSEFPQLSLPYDRLLANTKAGVTQVLLSPENPDTPHLSASGFDPLAGDTDGLVKRLRDLAAAGLSVVLVAEGSGSATRLIETLGREGLDVISGAITPGVIGVVVASLDRGFIISSTGVAVISESDLTGRRRVRRRSRGAARGTSLYDALSPGDYIVHQTHGVARFSGMVARDTGGATRDYLLLEYKGNDKLYVPTDQVHTVRRYTGGETPTLHRMGGADFERSKSRVRSAVQEIAEELVALYRIRLASPGYAFSPDTPWQHEIEEAFPFEETPDQARAIEEVKADMELVTPMDRLVCGDVGFGKTEVALRAAFKAVQDGKQVAILVPTTLLATQHGQTFRARFANYPIRVEVLSRFLSPKEQGEVVAKLSSGEVDIVIATHRLLSDDIKFHDLGLLIIDEEQRFGVQHKEKIKRFRVGVDALAISATPIPRTLELSLTGIRNLSLVNTPPEDRQPILTYVGEENDQVISEAIHRELLREGQVFFVHNRVKDIEFVADRVRNLVPEARVSVAHGQMDEGKLERVILDFGEHKIDVLVCTTIVESGLDIPSVNTLVVDRADRLGLAQLYQLRGRVGRRGQRAYAYLLHPPDQVLTEEAYERLKTIGEFTELGSGFKIAMRDLEIRGAGNLLGGAQSGQIAAVGFDLYCQLVTEAVGELTGTTPDIPVEITIDIPINAFLPTEYIGRDDVRMEAYRRLAAAQTKTDVDDVRAEWEDRYGPLPDPASSLIAVAHLRAECVRLGLRSVNVSGDRARLRGVDLPPSKRVRLERLFPGARARDNEFVVPLLGPTPEIAQEIIDLLAELFPSESPTDKPVVSAAS